MPFTSETARQYGGAKPGGGRFPTEAVRAIEHARIRLERYLARNLNKVAKTYIALAAGEVVKTKEGDIRLAVDPPTTRHAIERFVPAARQEIDLRAKVAVVEVGAFDPDVISDAIEVTATKIGKE